MKIAFFHELPPGGGRRAMNEFAKQLKKRHTVDLYVTDPKKNALEKKFYDQIFYYPFTPKAWSGGNWKVRLYKDTIELFYLSKLHKRIAQDLLQKKYDVVVISGSQYIEAPFIMKFLKTPFVFLCSDPNYRLVYDPVVAIASGLDPLRYYYEKLNRYNRKILDKQNIRFAKLSIAPSNYIVKNFTKTYKKDCRVVYYGVDTNLFKPKYVNRDIDIFYIGSYDPIDGYDLLKRVLLNMKKKPIVKIIATENEWISDDRELCDLYCRSKIVFCPARKEGLGAIALEAMSCGTPVVAVSEAGHKETVIDKVTGYLVKRNPKEVAQGLEKLLLDPRKIEQFGKNAREVILEKWTWNIQAAKLEKILKQYLFNFSKNNI